MLVFLNSSVVFAEANDGWVCPNCETRNTTNYCIKCGTKKPDVISCPVCRTEYQIDSGVLFCGNCGAKLQQSGSSSDENNGMGFDTEIGGQVFSIGSVVTFGSYEQDNNISNGTEPIAWIVIGQTNDSVNLITKDIIDLERYNVEKVDVTWATCNLRKWLNGTFLDAAFSPDEKQQIVAWEYKNTDDTLLCDYVYCLSQSEVEAIWPDPKDRVANVTDYVFAMSKYTNGTRKGQWWLRSESIYNGLYRTANDIYTTGIVGIDNYRNQSVGVRPCICVKKSAFSDLIRTAEVKQKSASQIVDLSEENYDQYFDVSVKWGSWKGKSVKIQYSIEPKDPIYAQYLESSSEILVEISVGLKASKDAKPFKKKNFVIMLDKSENYTASGELEITLDKNDLKQVFWDYDVISFVGAVSKEQEELIEQIVDIETEGIETEDAAHDLTYYTYQDAGIHFIVPDGWEEQPLSKEYMSLKYKMAPVNDKNSTSIMFGCVDVWKTCSESVWKNAGVYSRKEIDALMDKELLASLGDVDEKDITMKNIAGVQYGICKMKQTKYGIIVTMSCAFTIHDGYFIQFQMYDPMGKYSDVFEEVISSVYID